MRLILSLCTALLLSGMVQGQVWKNPGKALEGAAKGGKTGFSEEEAGEAIKEALTKGVIAGVDLVSASDGYLKNPEIKIPFPPEAKQMEKKLRAVGMGDKVDEFIVSMNRAAEDAASEAKPIFIGAIKKITVQDAISIVKEDGHPATDYLDRTTSAPLAQRFQPKIDASLAKVDATRLWEDLVKAYNKIPMVKKMEPDLSKYVTERAIDGLFVMVGKEEEKIRIDPLAQTSDLLKKVFGGK